MSTRFWISALIYMMVQAVLFGIGTVIVLATPFAAEAKALMPWVVAITFVLAAPLSWKIAPYMRAKKLYPQSRAAKREHMIHSSASH